MPRVEVRCRREPWRDGVEVLVVTKNHEGHDVYALPLTMTVAEPGAFIADPTMRLRNDEAQMLMDELWCCGLRPSEGSGSAGSLAATERHLNDMRSIAFGLLKQRGSIPKDQA